MSSHLFPYKWNLSDGYPAKGIDKNGCKVFGTFICGGGSTMGYKLAGYDHLGGVELDKQVADVYRINHNPKHLFVEDLRLFNQRKDIPEELFDLDLLDGSPPCSTFSMAGSREKAWGKKKAFREGQAVQRLDDLVFVYLRTIEILRPKVALLENVKGLIIGNAKAYAKEITRRFSAMGYNVQIFLLNAASMGVPQRRERVFFIGVRKDFDVPNLRMEFSEPAILFGQIEHCNLKSDLTADTFLKWQKAGQGKPIGIFQSDIKFSNNHVSQTIRSRGFAFHSTQPRRLSEGELKQIGSFPIDYNFNGVDVKYLIGMSVPPVMTAQIANQIWLQWLSKIKRQ